MLRHRIPSMDTSPVRIAVIGCGVIGPLHITCYQHSPGARVDCVCDLVEARAKGAAEKYGVRLTLSKEYADIRGGVILSNGSYDKNFSLETEFDSLREEIEPAVAAEIFGERK